MNQLPTLVLLDQAAYTAMVNYLKWMEAAPEWFEHSDRQYDMFTEYEHGVFEKAGVTLPDGWSFTAFAYVDGQLFAEVDTDTEPYSNESILVQAKEGT